MSNPSKSDPSRRGFFLILTSTSVTVFVHEYSLHFHSITFLNTANTKIESISFPPVIPNVETSSTTLAYSPFSPPQLHPFFPHFFQSSLIFSHTSSRNSKYTLNLSTSLPFPQPLRSWRGVVLKRGKKRNIFMGEKLQGGVIVTCTLTDMTPAKGRRMRARAIYRINSEIRPRFNRRPLWL